jgi:hypothetical protein
VPKRDLFNLFRHLEFMPEIVSCVTGPQFRGGPDLEEIVDGKLSTKNPVVLISINNLA